MLVHIDVHCENMYNVQLSSQILFSQLHVRSFESFGAAEWLIIVGRTEYVSLVYSTIFYPYLFCWLAGRM